MKTKTSTNSGIKSAQMKAVVLRADGTVKQDLGIVSYYHSNPFKQLAWNITHFFKGLK